MDKKQILEEVLERMIHDDVTIKFHSVVRSSDGAFKNASDLTRIDERRKKVLAAMVRQEQLRSALSARPTLSHDKLATILAKQDIELEQLRRRNRLLASIIRRTTEVASEGGQTFLREFMRKQIQVLDEFEEEMKAGGER
ncbi:hypothetical protein [Ferirhizobium litorale]|uniref:Uncharacterized protein n=1 Tax=Ferirhizobium litorale TaxID=2927786 RepID=A0AAE3QDQ6_9HYPH|nr:hypothetical protein [Fererhizobium litorale]MDI7923101.1 hypothetical protein [Fererhizobium litorale]